MIDATSTNVPLIPLTGSCVFTVPVPAGVYSAASFTLVEGAGGWGSGYGGTVTFYAFPFSIALGNDACSGTMPGMGNSSAGQVTIDATSAQLADLNAAAGGLLTITVTGSSSGNSTFDTLGVGLSLSMSLTAAGAATGGPPLPVVSEPVPGQWYAVTSLQTEIYKGGSQAVFFICGDAADPYVAFENGLMACDAYCARRNQTSPLSIAFSDEVAENINVMTYDNVLKCPGVSQQDMADYLDGVGFVYQ